MALGWVMSPVVLTWLTGRGVVCSIKERVLEELDNIREEAEEVDAGAGEALMNEANGRMQAKDKKDGKTKEVHTNTQRRDSGDLGARGRGGWFKQVKFSPVLTGGGCVL
jgi:hypothetical protein